MELKVFCVRDVKAEVFLQPMFMRTEAEAIRGFAQAANDPSNNLHNHAEDFVLYCLGKYDDNTGIISPYASPIAVISASVASTKHGQFYAARQISQAAVA